MTTVLKSLLNRAPPTVGRSSSILSGAGFGPNMESQLRSMTAVGTLFAIVDSISEAVGAVRWGLYRGDDEVPDHPAARLWAMPNPFTSTGEFLQTTQQHYELAGESVWYVGYSNLGMGPPLELWPVRPDRVTPVPDADRFLVGWVYRNAGEQIPWSVREVVQLRRPSPLDPYRGISPVAAALADIYGEQAAASYNNMFFRNSAEPGGIIEVDRHLSDAEWEEMIARWGEQHQGIERSHRIGVIEKAKWVERKYTMRDMQFEALRKLNREFIREAFRYPKSMLGSTEDVNKANALAAGYVFKDWLIRPRVEKVRSALNSKLLPLFGTMGQGLEFRYGEQGDNEILEDDRELAIKARETDATIVKMLVEAGFDPADVLAYVGLPELGYVGAPSMAAMGNRLGRRPLAQDDGARELWGQAEALKVEHPSWTQEQLAEELHLSARQLRRYRETFA